MAKKQLCGDQYISLWQNDSGTVTVKMGDGVTIVPVTADNEVILITEPSVAYDGLRSLLLVTGELEADEDPATGANRELQEELSLKAGRIDFIASVYQSIKYVESKTSIFLARDLEVSDLEGDEPEGWIEQQDPIPLDQIETLIAEGKLLNSETITALLLVRSFLEKEKNSS